MYADFTVCESQVRQRFEGMSLYYYQYPESVKFTLICH